MSTKLIKWRKATKKELKEDGADVVFIRQDEDGRKYTIYACKNHHGSWEQWGAEMSVLCDNVKTVEKWFNGELE